jgi:hypothetical protein
MADTPKLKIISKEDAVFWMDDEGRWVNAHGPFENAKINAYFHSCIQKDADGFYLQQEREGLLEKVYFRVADTAFFVFRVAIDSSVVLTLNTGRVLPLDPGALFICKDRLYVRDDGERIKFTVGAAMKVASYLEEDETGVVFCFGGARTPVLEEETLI